MSDKQIRHPCLIHKWRFSLVDGAMRLLFSDRYLQRLQYAFQPLPAFACRSDVQALLWRVDTEHLGADGHHIQIWILLQEQTALQARMDSQYLWLCSKQIVICFLRHFQQWRLGVRCPTWVAIAMCHLVASQCQSTLYHLLDIVFLALDRGALASIHLDICALVVLMV